MTGLHAVSSHIVSSGETKETFLRRRAKSASRAFMAPTRSCTSRTGMRQLCAPSPCLAAAAMHLSGSRSKSGISPRSTTWTACFSNRSMVCSRLSPQHLERARRRSHVALRAQEIDGRLVPPDRRSSVGGPVVRQNGHLQSRISLHEIDNGVTERSAARLLGNPGGHIVVAEQRQASAGGDLLAGHCGLLREHAHGGREGIGVESPENGDVVGRGAARGAECAACVVTAYVVCPAASTIGVPRVGDRVVAADFGIEVEGPAGAVEPIAGQRERCQRSQSCADDCGARARLRRRAGNST